jgi:type I site-specific restriction-modification system R (restriction) subunit
VNGLPLVQIELKKRGVAIREAFNQVHRYSKESFNNGHHQKQNQRYSHHESYGFCRGCYR